MTRVRELSVTYRPHPSGIVADARSLSSPAMLAAILAPMLEHQAQEIFVIVLLNTKRHLIAVHDVAKGGIDCVNVDPRCVFRAALLANAAAIALGHNHPSGDPTPSPDDIALTRRLQDCGNLLGIEVIDHLIVGDGRYCSFRETGRM